MLASCSSNDVATNHLIQKRKHRQGFHLNMGLNRGSSQTAMVKPDPSDFEKMEVEQELSLDQEKFERKRRFALAKTTPAESSKEKGKSWIARRAHSAKERQVKSFERAMEGSDVMQSESAKIIFPEEGEEEDDMSKKGLIAVVAGVLTWMFAIGSIVANFIIPGLGLVFSALALGASIVAVVFGNKSQDDSDAGLVGFILGLIYLILVAIALVITIIFIVLIIAALGGV